MKKLISIFLVAILMLSLSVPAFAAESTVLNESSVTVIEGNSDEEITTYADVIVVYFLTIGDKMYYRHWNQTRGYWVDDYWIFFGYVEEA